MIRVMLVDDEPFIRVAIKTLFNWEKNGFKITSEANNGEAAIIKIKYDQPDLIITDIKMPITDGMNLIKYVKIHYPNIKCVVLSNYGEFELTRSAFVEGAVDYLLKNDLNNDSFLSLTRRLRKEFFDQHIASDIPIKQSGPPPEKIIENKLSAIKSLINGTENIDQCVSVLDDKMSFVLCNLYIDLSHIPTNSSDFSDIKINLIKNTILKIISEISEFKSYYYSETSEKYVLLIYNNEKESSIFLEKVNIFLKSLCFSIHKYLNTLAAIGVSEIKTNIKDLPAAYNQALQLARNLFYNVESAIYFYQSNEKSSNKVSEYIRSHIDIFSCYIGNKDWNNIDNFFSDLCSLIKTEKTAPKKARKYIMNLIFLLQGEIVHQRINGLDNLPDNSALFDKIQKSQKMSDLEIYIQRYLIQLKKNSCDWEKKLFNYSNIVNNAIQYLHLHFQDPDVNLNSVADAISVNESYLSRSFFKETKVHFNSYLTDLRLNYSKNLLVATTDTISAIAKKCGYNNGKYYYHLFKKAEGTTPSTYRNDTHNYQNNHPETTQ